MGWAGGSEIAENVWDVVRKHIPNKNRKSVAKKIVNIFENADCDTMYECGQLMQDAGLEDREEEDYE